MTDEEGLRWPYGFRFEWGLKRAQPESNGPGDDFDEPIVKIKPPPPAIPEIMRHLPNHVNDQLQSTLVSLSKFHESLNTLQLSEDTKRIVLQRVLSDMAGNEREDLLVTSSWWRQKALEYGVGYVDALTSHYLFLNLTSDLAAEWNLSRKKSDLEWESEEKSKRRIALSANAADHISGLGASSVDSAMIEAYLARAEVTRELLIYANGKICSTVPAKEDDKDISKDTLVATLFNDNPALTSSQLEHCKRLASIVQLGDLCEQNNWCLVVCHVETDQLSGQPKLFRRLLSVVSNLDDDPTRAKALVRPAIQPYPLFALTENKTS